jgi:transketolase
MQQRIFEPAPPPRPNGAFGRKVKESLLVFLLKIFDDFRKNHSDRFFNMGICEQSLIGVASGMALEGYKPWVYTITPFLIERPFEQIKLDINLMNLPVTIFGVGASYSYDTSGPTHHSIEDISILRTMKNLKIFSPSDNNILDYIFNYSLKSKNPLYIRLDRKPLDVLSSNKFNFKNGFRTFGEMKSKKIIISTGNMSHVALKAIKIYNQHFKEPVCFIDVFSTKLSIKNFLNTIKKAKLIVSLEEHILEGGLGSIIAELLFDNKINKKLDLIRMGINLNKMYTYKSRHLIHKMNKITPIDIVKEISK